MPKARAIAGQATAARRREPTGGHLTGPQIVAALDPLDGGALLDAVRRLSGLPTSGIARVTGLHPDTLAKIGAGRLTTRAQRAALAWCVAYAQDAPDVRVNSSYARPLWSERRVAARVAGAAGDDG